MKDEDLAKAIKTQTKELHKLCGKLKNDGLIKTDAVAEYYPAQQGKERRKFTRSHYYIDYESFVNVVKWRVFQIGRKIEREVHEVSYSMQLFKLLSHKSNCTEGGFICPDCDGELALPKTETTNGVSQKYTKFMTQSQPIVEILKLTDKMQIPKYEKRDLTADPNAPPASADTAGVAENGTTSTGVDVHIVDDDEAVGVSNGYGGEQADGNGTAIDDYYATMTPASSQDIGDEHHSNGTKRPFDDIKDDDEEDEFSDVD
ncbi:hypothetical protein HK097_007303 [Rhizophlyctis rosea]|uniref:HTH TFE/IIEalpha-type domain-containing protein n=1 Tax=Rhizophlyctis rosea TaxID=64517 RepID=A0AAD5SJF2_9FUNG|nr:hypothetical protein HK097_007303 [Rhizophlyctis rosea]